MVGKILTTLIDNIGLGKSKGDYFENSYFELIGFIFLFYIMSSLKYIAVGRKKFLDPPLGIVVDKL